MKRSRRKKKKPLILAFVGPPLAGKGKFIEDIVAWCGALQVAIYCTGDMIRQMLEIIGEPQERPNCSKLVELLSTPKPRGYGQAFLPNAVKKRIKKDRRPVIIFDSMRFLEDEKMIRELAQEGYEVITIYVTASKEIRYERLKERNRNGESKMSRKKFYANENLATEKRIREIGSRAEYKFRFGRKYKLNDARRLRFCRERLPHHAVKQEGDD